MDTGGKNTRVNPETAGIDRYFTLWVTVLTLLLYLSVASAGAVEIKVASVMPEGSPWTVTLREMAKEIYQRTGGEADLKIYAGGVSGDEIDVIRKMRANRIHAAGFTGVGLSLLVPEIRLLDSIMLFKTSQEVDYVKGKLYDDFEAAFEKKGYVFLHYVDGGFVYFFSKSDISTPQALKNVKMWLWGDDKIAETFFSTFGIKAFPLNVADVNTGLETGMIDSFYCVPVAAIAFQWHWRVKYLLDYPIVNSTGGLVVSKRVFNRLTPEHQEIMRKVTAKYCARLVEITRKSNVDAMSVLKDAGITFVRPTPELLAEFKTAAQKTYQENMQTLYPKALFDKALKFLKEYRSRQP